MELSLPSSTYGVSVSATSKSKVAVAHGGSLPKVGVATTSGSGGWGADEGRRGWTDGVALVGDVGRKADEHWWLVAERDGLRSGSLNSRDLHCDPGAKDGGIGGIARVDIVDLVDMTGDGGGIATDRRGRSSDRGSCRRLA